MAIFSHLKLGLSVKSIVEPNILLLSGLSGPKTTEELLTHPIVMTTDEELKVQAQNADDLHVVCSYLEVT